MCPWTEDLSSISLQTLPTLNCQSRKGRGRAGTSVLGGPGVFFWSKSWCRIMWDRKQRHSRHLLLGVVLLNYPTKQSKTKTFAVFLLINRNKLHRKYWGLFLHNFEPVFPGRMVHLHLAMQRWQSYAQSCSRTGRCIFSSVALSPLSKRRAMLWLYFAQCPVLHKCSSLPRTSKEMSIVVLCCISCTHKEAWIVGCIKAMSLAWRSGAGTMVRFKDGSIGFMGGFTYITQLWFISRWMFFCCCFPSTED